MQKALTGCQVQKLILAIFIFCSWVAQAQAPQIGGLVELQGLLNARAADEKGNIDFHKNADSYKKYVLAAGTRGQITGFHKLASGNYGIKVRLLNVKGIQEEVWVYYQPDQKNPDMHLYSMKDAKDINGFADDSQKIKVAHVYKKATSVEVATALQTVRQITSIGDSVKKTTSSIDIIDQVHAVDLIAKGNSVVKKVGNPAPISCKDCQINADPLSCNSKNDYLQKIFQKQTSPVVEILTERQPSFKLMNCMENEMVKTGSKFVDCDSNSKPKIVPKACITEDYKKLMANAFELVSDCTLDYATVEKSPNVKSNLESLLYGVISHESGFHTNIRINLKGHPDAIDSGAGQFTGDGINMVNGIETGSSGYTYFQGIKEMIQAKDTPACRQLDKMNLQAMRPGGQYRCDAISIEKGNPVLSLLYAIGHMRANRDLFLGAIVSLKDNNPAKRNFNSLPEETQELLMNYVKAWGHNHPAIRSRVIAELASSRGMNLLKTGNPADVEAFILRIKNEKSPYIASVISRAKRGESCLN